MCINEDEFCNKCKSCLEFDNSNNPDYFEILPENNSIKIEQIRNINKKVYEKPIVSNRKVYIINEAETMTKEAQNSLLKTLEEPPEFVCIILITSNESKLLNTIRSRCIKINFSKLTDNELENVLKDVTPTILKMAGGSVEKAIELKEKQVDYENIKNIILRVETLNLIDIMNKKEEIFKDKANVQNILDYMASMFLEMAKNNINKADKYTKCIELVEETKARLKANANYDMTIDRLLFGTCEELQ